MDGWTECWNCGGEGFTHHDCGEDTCCCLEPEDNVICDTCMGMCGWQPETESDIELEPPSRRGRMTMETHIATWKTHRCDACGRRIPIGSRYFVGDDNSREHTNCCDFINEKELPPGYNLNRSASRRGRVK